MIQEFIQKRPDIDIFYIEMYKFENKYKNDNLFFTNQLFTQLISKTKLLSLKSFVCIGIWVLEDDGEPDECVVQLVSISNVLKIQKSWRLYRCKKRMERMDLLREELMIKAWNPKRLIWCLEYDDELFSLIQIENNNAY